MASRDSFFIFMSSVSRNSPKGNVAKHLSYREAWSRIKKALEQGFYLEAVTLEESIITDRLISHLVGVGAVRRAVELKDYPGFAQLIQKWKIQNPDPIDTQDYCDLQTAVDEWRRRRNKVVHGMVKSHPGTATDSIMDFLEEAKLTAEQGKMLARAVSNWVRKMRT